MATFDQLAADQRAIIEIVLKQGKSYAQIGEMLDLPPARVRELARDALAELAPFTAEFVDSDWRGQLADYVLGEQTGPEAQATRGHLRRSEPARIWAYSLLDALDDFYGDGDRPEIPLGEAGPSLRARTRAREEAVTNGEAPPAAAVGAAGLGRAGRGLSPGARAALMRRRIAGGLVGALVLAGLVFGGIAIFGGGSSKHKTAATTTPTAASQAPAAGATGQSQLIAAARLSPIGGFKGSGVAGVAQSRRQYYMLVNTQLPPPGGGKKYVVWLYNSDKQLAPIASAVPGKNGTMQFVQPLPNGWQNFRFVDVTEQSVQGKTPVHGQSVMRGPLLASQAGGASGSSQPSGGSGTTTTP